MAVKTGADHLKSLRDGRAVYLDGKRIDDVTTHPAFRNACATIAAMYDYQADPANIEKMTFASPTTGDRVSRAWELQRSLAEMQARRDALMDWARLHFGFMGRSPDFIASGLAGMRMGYPILAGLDKKRADAVRGYYEFARDRDLFVTYGVVNPQGDRSKGASDQGDAFHSVAVVDEDAAGITVRGGKMLGTSAIMANEVFIGNVVPLRDGEENYAVAFCVPLNAKGLKILSRKSYEGSATSAFDNPLSSRLDENDAVFWLEDVKVPWDRVFATRDIKMSRDIFHATPAHVSHNYQSQIRLVVKLQFLLAIARRIAEVNGIIAFPQVRETLGKLAAQATMVEAMLSAIETSGQTTADGAYYYPSRQFLYATLCVTQTLYNGFVNDIRELAGGGLIMLPSSIEDFASPEIAPWIRRTQRSGVTDAEGRVKFFKLAWDALGSEFASRHAQYEMFYVGASFVTRGYMFANYPWAKGEAMLDGILESYDVASELAKTGRKPADRRDGGER
ncbi:MAG: 4-hydroxyphenylacetate 3-monooxygenase [Alphaproteobacteria bacterium]|nr:4-hydroxyphenylacetate 3-monooxygenase [Alphaproteobacteria bacterium]